MAKNDDAFFLELLSMFKIEAEEHLKAISSGLIEVEKIEDVAKQASIIETVFREAHSLKGAARAVNLINVETICQSLESVLSALKNRSLTFSANLFDILLKAVDTLNDVIESPESTDISGIMQKLTQIEEQITKEKVISEQSKAKKKGRESKSTDTKISKVSKTKVKSNNKKDNKRVESEPEIEDTNQQTTSVETGKTVISDTVRISTSKLDSLLLQAEEMLSSKLSSEQQASNIRDIINYLDDWKKEWNRRDSDIRIIRKAVERSRKNGEQSQADMTLAKLVDFLGWNYDYTKALEDRLISVTRFSSENSRSLGGMVDNLLEDMKKILMLPFSILLKILPKIVRDLSRDQRKDVELIVKGSTIEIDRRILEELKDPFIHLLRNCIDHAIEKPEERLKQKKPSRGTVSIVISQIEGNKVEIILSDNGRGIDINKVRAVAVKRGIISEEEANVLNEYQTLMLIFQSEVSTSPIITDLSGRGLGLPIVREKVEKLGGTISLETKLGIGTKFRIVLPVTLATFRGTMVQVSDQLFVVPTVNVERVVRVKRDDIKTVENRETVSLNGRTLSFIKLADVLEIQQNRLGDNESQFIQALILGSGEKQIVFGVDRIKDEQEVLVKGLGRQLVRIRNIGGATILGTGKVVSILNVSDLMKSAVKAAKTPIRKLITEEEKVGKQSILVAEDSITSRTLLKNILESAGYQVKTTVDGIDALTALRSENFDLIVSDIEMPRMNGFDLVTKIRDDKRTSDLPVILVTALESREDRERGIDVGANAYIVKRSFDQSNLLDVIKKLI
jgi:two-component system chemotaxis sensor kinase CheA